MKRAVIVLLVVLVIAVAALGFLGEEKDYESLSEYGTATFAGGCFWCMEAAFESVDGVVEAVSGYTGGTVANPTYQQVSMGNTGHLEAVQVYFNPDVVSYSELVDVFWRSINPTDAEGQFVDRGSQYATAVFYHDLTQKALAEASRDTLEASGRFDKPIVTGIVEFSVFYEAEEYHQDYYKKNVLNYELYSRASGREEFLEEHWGE
jgi:peptide methionine sulfoxide reductase msrA/msrB